MNLLTTHRLASAEADTLEMVRTERLELSRIASLDPKSSASTIPPRPQDVAYLKLYSIMAQFWELPGLGSWQTM